MLDLLRWPLRNLKSYFVPPDPIPINSSTVVGPFQSDSLGLVDSGYVDRKLDLGSKRGPIDMPLPEYHYQSRQVETSLSPAQVERLGNGPVRKEGPFRRTMDPRGREAGQFAQVYTQQPYDRETSMPFSQMPTVY